MAKQNGKAIFSCALSFQTVEQGFEHQLPMPNTPDPEQMESEHDYLNRMRDQLPPHATDINKLFPAWDIRRVKRRDPVNPQPTEAQNIYWFKVKGELSDDPILHQTLLAYISGLGLMCTAMNPHPIDPDTPGLQGISLDHSMWFHSPYRADQWFMHATDSPRAIGARGLCRGSFFDIHGELFCSTAQEGLMRIKK